MPLLFLLLYPKYCIENFAIATPGPATSGPELRKQTLDASPVGIGKRDF
jgi:hypothetical protein